MNKYAWLIFGFLALTWGSSFILMKKGLEAFSPLQVAALRIVIASLTTLPFILHRVKDVPPKSWRYILFVGIIGNGIPAFLFPLAEQYIDSGTAGVLNSLSPVFVLIFGLLFFNLQVKLRQAVGISLGFAGALLLTMMRGGEFDPFDNLFYSLMVVLATMGYGLSTIVMKRYLNETPSILASGFALSFVSIPYASYLIFFSDMSAVMTNVPTAWTSLFYIGLLGAIGTALAVILFYQLIQMTDAIIAASVTYLIPLVALGWGIIDGEEFTIGQFVGILVILFGVWLV
ncbi:MAG: DMT family transporter, partial [Bacteroidota bacterium]